MKRQRTTPVEIFACHCGRAVELFGKYYPLDAKCTCGCVIFIDKHLRVEVAMCDDLKQSTGGKQ